MRALARFSRDAQGRMRDVRGRFVAESQAINRHLTNNPPTLTVNTDPALRSLDQFSRDAQGRLRDAQGRFVRDGDTAGRGLGGGLLAGLGETVRTGIGGAFSSALSGLRGAASAVQTNPYVSGIGAALAAGVVASALPAIGALLAGAVITVSGLSIIGIGAALLKDEPEVKKAATRLKDTVQGIFERAAQPLKRPFVEALTGLEQTAKDVAPQIEQAFQTVAESGAIKSLTDGIDRLVKNALPGFLKLLEDTGPTFEGIKQLLSDVGEGLNGFFEGIAGSGPEAKLAFEDLGKAIKGLLIAAGETIGFLAKLYAHTRRLVAQVVDAFQWLYDRLIGNSIIPDIVNGAVRLFRSLPGRAASALASLAGRVGERALQAGARLLGVIRERVGSAVATLRGMPGRAFAALGKLAGSLRDRAVAAGASMVRALRDKISDAVGAVRGMPGRATSALGNLSGRLVSAGRDLIRGMISGIRDMAGSLVSAARDVVGDAIDGAKNLLGISSPSKVFAEIGQDTGQGFIEGLAGMQRKVTAAVGNVAGMVPETFTTSLAANGAGLGVSSMRTSAAPVRVINNINLNLTNHGAIGSQIEMRDWLARSLDDLNRQGRLPKAA